MKPSMIICIAIVATALTACAGPRQPQANDCEVINKGKPAAIEACRDARRASFWSFL